MSGPAPHEEFRLTPPADADARTRRRLAAIEDAVREHHPLLVSWLTKKLGDPAVASDIAQEAYLRVWRFAQDGEVGDARALIFKAAANLAANEFKSRRRFRLRHVEIDSARGPVEAIAADQPNAERAECARQDLARCRAAIDSLPEKARRAFILSRFEELTYRQIAQRLAVSESSVEKYIILALKTLRASLEDDGRPSTVVKFARRGARWRWGSKPTGRV
jgi:RNA polymerase sigma factor (sigma-70 family)